jgi:pimeloyl-ACP methyl ester carboxylesterase
MRTILAMVLATAAIALGAAGTAAADLPPGVSTVQANGIEIGYRSTGAGRPLLLINGSGATLDTWDPHLLRLLAAHRRVIVFDPRGFGSTTDVPGNHLRIRQMADDAAGLIIELNLSKVDVLGWSLGGFVAQELALRHRTLVRRLVLASTSAGGRTAIETTPERQAIDEKTTRGLATPDEFLPLLFPPAHQDAGQAWIGRLLDQPGGCCEAFTPEAGEQQVLAGRAWNAKNGGTYRRLPKLRVRTLIGAGKKDIDIPFGNARILHRRIAHSKLIAYPDAGHAFLIQEADRFAPAVLKFLG